MVTPVLGGIGAPIGMFVIVGSGLMDALLNVESSLPTLIGPLTVTPFFWNVIDELGCVQSEPWKVCALFVNVIAVVLAASGAIVSIDVLLLVPCQFVKSQGGPVAHSAVPLPFTVNVPATAIAAGGAGVVPDWHECFGPGSKLL